MSNKVLIYTKDYCPYCTKAKSLLDILGASYEEIDLTNHPDKLDEMVQKANGGRTVPQIFVNDKHIGGCDDMHALHAQGKLVPLLALHE